MNIAIPSCDMAEEEEEKETWYLVFDEEDKNTGQDRTGVWMGRWWELLFGVTTGMVYKRIDGAMQMCTYKNMAIQGIVNGFFAINRFDVKVSYTASTHRSRGRELTERSQVRDMVFNWSSVSAETLDIAYNHSKNHGGIKYLRDMLNSGNLDIDLDEHSGIHNPFLGKLERPLKDLILEDMAIGETDRKLFRLTYDLFSALDARLVFPDEGGAVLLNSNDRILIVGNILQHPWHAPREIDWEAHGRGEWKVANKKVRY